MTIGLVNQVCINIKKKNMSTQATAAVCHFICCLNRLTSVTSLDQRNYRIPNGQLKRSIYAEQQRLSLETALVDFVLVL